MACPALQCFSTLSDKRHDFRKKVIEQNMCILSLSTILSETFLILRRTEREMKKKVGFHVNYRYFCHILIKLEFSGQILEKYSNMKIS